jgi:hypothetical protein
VHASKSSYQLLVPLCDLPLAAACVTATQFFTAHQARITSPNTGVFVAVHATPSKARRRAHRSAVINQGGVCVYRINTQKMRYSAPQNRSNDEQIYNAPQDGIAGGNRHIMLEISWQEAHRTASRTATQRKGSCNPGVFLLTSMVISRGKYSDGPYLWAAHGP